ncbi:NAD+ synthase [Kiloniella laminariae]|uniref:Glutamine-dependent NAD(+) synthetase n=1 Tax=Kiloniella laminariae TaxID=454162 RepID=A0ABT4LHR4_9PROT|nr:NAD+ synthase [Kiloniella laminariae]MCZ4280628.1 NAD+ synthase [Kiloniella laminariae]
MTKKLTIAFAQINPTVGDIRGNLALIRSAREKAAAAGADLLVTPELCLVGYPPEDLVLKPEFLIEAQAALRDLMADTADGGPGILVGAPIPDQKLQENPFKKAFTTTGSEIYNAAVLLDAGGLVAWRGKHFLCDYSVFDEKRVFKVGALTGPFAFRGVRVGVFICEDMWDADVCETLAEAGAEMLIGINGSQFNSGKGDTRMQLAVQRVTECELPLAYLNMVGGQDDIVFDGGSFVLNADCTLQAQAPQFEEHLLVTEWARGEEGGWACLPAEKHAPEEDLAAVYRALVLGVRDYIRKNHFPGIVIGMSGGIDSALSAAIAVDAIGAERVRCVMMPSPYTSADSLEDAERAAEMLGVRYDSISIGPAMKAFEEMLAPMMAGTAADTTEENIQARSRGLTLMAISNKLGFMVLSTGNKSEMSVGYATLYGDMCGGYNALKDVYKTKVFALSRWRNAHRPTDTLGPDGPVMPERIITKPPSAELKPDQKDQDSLPEYDVLDGILECLIEEELPLADILARGYDEETVYRIWRMLDLAEYKRRQSAPGVRVTLRDLARDRRYPITNAFRGRPRSVV